MTDERNLDEFDRELRALLRVEPSPDFMAGVRARLEEKRSRRAWWWLAPALAAGLAALLLARTSLRDTPAPAPTPRAAAVAPTPAEPAAPDVAPAAPVGRAAVPRRPPAPARPDAIVVSLEDQRALAAYVAMARARRGRPLPGLIASTTDDAALAAPPPIDIPPIETPPLPEPAGLLPGTRSDS